MSDDVIQDIANSMEDDDDKWGGDCKPSQVIITATTTVRDIDALLWSDEVNLCMNAMNIMDCPPEMPNDTYGPGLTLLDAVLIELHNIRSLKSAGSGSPIDFLDDDDWELLPERVKIYLTLKYGKRGEFQNELQNDMEDEVRRISDIEDRDD